MKPPLGTIVHYVTRTRMGDYVLPAEIYSFEGLEAQMRVFTDDSGSSEWMVAAIFDAGKTPGTWHFRT